MVEYKWTPKSLKASQTGPSPAIQRKSVNSLDSQDTIGTSSKDIQRSHVPYLILRKRPLYGTGENHNTRPLKNSKPECALAPSSHNPTSKNRSSSKPTHQLMAWAPYSRRRVNTTQSPPKNLNYTQLHFTRRPSHPLNETTTSTNGS